MTPWFFCMAQGPDVKIETCTFSQRRFFYTDPLAAAWMARHFGMKFEPQLNSGLRKVNHGGYVTEAWEIENSYGLAKRQYIHPDSLPLLEPQVGDLGLFRLYRDPTPSEVVPIFITVPVIKPDVIGIIQRNGVLFHWPESEEIEEQAA
jgi:hypothetical protein